MEACWIGGGLLLGTYLNWRLLAGRLRIYSETAGNAITLPTFFENRFHDQSHLLRLISAFFILLFFLFYTSSGLVAGGKLFNTVFSIPYQQAVALGSLAILLYTLLGGFLAVSWTDVVQSLLMLFALLAVPIAAIAALGGPAASFSATRTLHPDLLEPLTSGSGTPLGPIAILSLLGWGLGYFGQPHILARFKAVHTPAAIPAARRIAVTWAFLGMGGALLVGLAAIPFLPEPLSGAATEKVFMLLVQTLFHPLLAGILLAAVLAAIMSTADSQLLVASAAFTEDLYRLLFRRRAGTRELMLVSRGAVLLVAMVAMVLALAPESKVLDLVSYAWAGFGAAFGPALILSLYWQKMSRDGALAGIITGGLTVVIWKQLNGGLFDLYEIVPGFTLATLAILTVSMLRPDADPSIVREFEEARGRWRH